MNSTTSPTREQVREELEKIISKEFSGSPTRRALLEYIVSSSLNGEEMSGKDISSFIFPGIDPDSGNVKVNVSFIRDHLESYFASEGARDLVHIELPIGRTYKATFSYRYNPEAYRLYEKGLSFLGSDGRANRLQAKRCFDLAILADNTLSAAHVSRLQVSICELLIEHVLATKQYEGSCVPEFLEGEIETLDSNPTFWFAWCLHGMARLIMRHFEKAKEAFERALSLDSVQTSANICYAFYLLVTGKREEALRASQLWDNSKVDDRMYVARGLFFYLAGERRSAIESLLSPRVLGREMIVINLLLQGLIKLSSEQKYNYYEGRMKIFLASSPWSISSNGEEEMEFSQNLYEYRSDYKKGENGFWRGYVFPDLFPGFNILALAKNAKKFNDEKAEAEELLAQLQKKFDARSFQLAIASLAVGQKNNAVKYLRQATIDGDVLARFTDVWPFLSELRGHPALERLNKTLAMVYQ
jgi:Tetratricopeptide repeat